MSPTSRVVMLVGQNANEKPCNILTSSNATSVPLAANWENIPETLLLNGSIGFILYILFLTMTQLAWGRSESGDGVNEDLISFLYGYRDPQRWYIIPRFEFLRRGDRHHNHDLGYPNIYLPPKLPLANPIELFAHDDNNRDDSKSVDEQNKTRKSINNQLTQMMVKDVSIIDQQKSKSIKKTVEKSGSLSKAALSSTFKTLEPSITNDEPDSSGQKEAPGARLTPLEQSFFYPSILTAEQLQASYLSKRLNRFFSMFFRITDADIIYAKGIDAYEYLLFQRHLILIMFITNLFCLGIILPVHWFCGTNHLEPNLLFTTSFQRSTIKNMSYDSVFYWAHIISSICIVCLTIMILNSYRDSTIAKNDTQLARKTLLIGNIPTEQRSRPKLSKVIQKYFTTSHVEAIQFVYNISLLERYQMQLESIAMAKEYCQYYKRKYNQEIMVKPTDVNEGQYCNGNCRLCSFFYVCCCVWPCETKEPGTVFYARREQYYRDRIKRTCELMVKKPTEYAFVTFKSYKQAKRVMAELTRLKSEALSQKFQNIFARKSIKTTSLPVQKSAYYASATNRKSVESAGCGLRTIKQAARNSDVLVTSSNAPNDPLDPANNPHVRSIRSPKMKRLTIGIGLKQTKQKEDQQQQQQEQRNMVQHGSEVPGGPSSLIGAKLEGPITWSIRYAPHPDNVEYYDLLHIATTSRYTIVLLHALMVIIFIFITTPNVLLSILERWSVLQPDKATELTGFRGMVINYMSVLLQIITTALLPALITLISKQIPYEDTASKNHSIMWKVYLFLVLMVIVMPSVGMSSAQALLSSDINPKCLFPTDNGAYFINYVLSSIFLSTILELIKPVDIISYYFILLSGRSSADFEGGRQYIEREFSVSMQHTGVLLVFSVVMTYTISCPLIAPVGLLYLIIKHAVDHYHLFYTYFTKKVDKNLQNTIEIFVRVALLLMLFQTTVAISLNTGTSYFSLLSQIVFWIPLAVFLFNCFFDCTSRAMISTKRNEYQREFCACFYLPRVIEDLLRLNAIPESCISRTV